MTHNEITTLADQVGIILKRRGLWVCAAESCTGGLFLSSLTDISGSSAWVAGGVVSYSNEVKQQVVGVQEATLNQYGAVSEPTAREMAAGVRKLIGADIGIGITGIAGPGGGSSEKPVGLVYIGMATPESTTVERCLWQGDRIENKQQSVVRALQMILQWLSAHGETQR
jgi:nicotinamide-nucleotide amidase